MYENLTVQTNEHNLQNAMIEYSIFALFVILHPAFEENDYFALLFPDIPTLKNIKSVLIQC